MFSICTPSGKRGAAARLKPMQIDRLAGFLYHAAGALSFIARKHFTDYG
jgi:hypothetical protein